MWYAVLADQMLEGVDLVQFPDGSLLHADVGVILRALLEKPISTSAQQPYNGLQATGSPVFQLCPSSSKPVVAEQGS
jgi:hypothetical protein